MTTSDSPPSGALARILPIAGWLPGYPRDWLRFDLLAGLTTAAVVIPQAMAYAAIAGLPVQAGLYTALVPLVIYAFFGSSRPLSVSTTSTIAMLVATQLLLTHGADTSAYPGTAAALAFLTGLFLLLAGLLRLGFLANFISQPVLTGFKAGVGVVILSGQLGKVLGLDIPQGPPLATLGAVLAGLPDLHWPTFLLALATLALLLLLPRIAPRVPAPLLAVALGIGATLALGLGARGVALVGPIPPGLPPLTPPDLSGWPALVLGALGIALMSFVESIAAARVFAAPHDPPVDADQELRALGLANLGGSFFQAIPAGGGTSQTAVADGAGARSQITGLVVAAAVLLTLLFFSGLLAEMPEATLGALVIVAAAGLIKPRDFAGIGRVHRRELGWALVAFLGVIFLGTLQGIAVAVIVSLASLLHTANHHEVYELGRQPGTGLWRPLAEHPGDETLPGLCILRTEGLLYFANVERVAARAEALLRDEAAQVLIFDAGAVPDLEYTAVRRLQAFRAQLARQGTELWLAALNPDAQATLGRAAPPGQTPPAPAYPTVERAVEAFLARESGDEAGATGPARVG